MKVLKIHIFRSHLIPQVEENITPRHYIITEAVRIWLKYTILMGVAILFWEIAQAQEKSCIGTITNINSYESAQNSHIFRSFLMGVEIFIFALKKSMLKKITDMKCYKL